MSDPPVHLIEAQLREELGRSILGPLGRIIGEDVAASLVPIVERRAAELARRLSEPDRASASAAAATLRELIPERPHAWWQSPLGQAMAALVGPTETISQAEAGRILGLTRGRITQLVQAGKIETGTDGRPLLAAVLGRIVWTRERRQNLRDWPGGPSSL